MDLPVANIVSEIDLKPSDVLLPLYEVVVNSIISLIQTKDLDNTDKRFKFKYSGEDSVQILNYLEIMLRYLLLKLLIMGKDSLM